MSFGSADSVGVVKKPKTSLTGTAPPAPDGQLLPQRVGLSLAVSVMLNRPNRQIAVLVFAHVPPAVVWPDVATTVEHCADVAPATSKLPMLCVVPGCAGTWYVLNTWPVVVSVTINE